MRPYVSPEPNVTPMIDVLLVLLIIFMAAIPEQRKALVGQLPPDERGGSRTARYQEVVTAVDVARGAGVTVIGVDTRP